MQSVYDGLGYHLNELICSTSSIAIIVNPSRYLSQTEDPKSMVAIISINIRGHGDGKLFTDHPGFGSSMAEGVANYIVSMKDTILLQFMGANITEMK